MSDDQQPGRQEIDLNVRFQKAPPRPAKVHRVRDIAWLFVASAIIGSVFKSPALVGVVFCAAVVLYVIGGPVVKRQRQ